MTIKASDHVIHGMYCGICNKVFGDDNDSLYRHIVKEHKEEYDEE